MATIQAMTPSRSPHIDSRLPQVLNAAARLFGARGFDGTSVRDIARAVGMLPGSLYCHFATKEDLYRRVVQQIFEIWLDAAASFDDAPGPIEGIGAYIDAKMDISRTHPHGSKVWASEVMHGAPVIQDYLETTLRDWTEGRIAVIQRWIDAGKMKPVNPRHLLYLLWATTQHYADFGHQIQTLNGGAPLTEAQWREAKTSVKDMVLRGIGAI